MVVATLRELEAAGVKDRPEVVLADAGYWHQTQMENVINQGMQVLIPPDAANGKGARPGWEGGIYAHMRRVLSSDYGGGLYETQGDDRAGVRAHKVQPGDHPVHATRQIRGPLGVAANRRDAQPVKAPPPPDRRRRGLGEPQAPERNNSARCDPAAARQRATHLYCDSPRLDRTLWPHLPPIPASTVGGARAGTPVGAHAAGRAWQPLPRP